MRGDPSANGPGIRSVPRWLRAWPWWVAGFTLVLLGIGAALAVLSKDLSIAAVSSDDSWDGRLAASLLLIPAPVVGALIATRRPASWYGWAWLGFGLGGGLLEFGSGYVATSLAGANLPYPSYVGVVSGPGWSALFLSIPFLLLLFPTGHLPSPSWRHMTRMVFALGVVTTVAGLFIPGELGTAPILNPLGIEGPVGSALEAVVGLCTLVVMAMAVPSALSLFVRYHAAGGRERQQIKWFAFAALLLVIMVVSDFVWELDGLLEALKEGVPIALMPIAIGFAILRHRLYDIDRIISRTLSYGLLTASLGALFVLTVFLFRHVFPFDGQFPVAVSTLAVAAMFNPLRSRLQRSVDRRFNRSTYDAVATIENFSRVVRTDGDLHEVQESLLTVAAGAMEPAYVALWLHPGAQRL